MITNSRVPYRILLLWIVLIILFYYLVIPSQTHPYAPYALHTQAALLSEHMKDLMPQAIAFIAMGKIASQMLVGEFIVKTSVWERILLV